MDCTLFITTYNWPKALGLCLNSILDQTVMPNEVILADDGSGPETKALIEDFKKSTEIPMKHCWQPDEGYRINRARNMAIRNASFDYIIQIDGDIIMHRKFVADHLKFAKKGRFLLGRRVRINGHKTERLLSGEKTRLPHPFRSALLCWLNEYFLYHGKSVRGLRGCNVSYWKDDAIRLNGYDETLTSKGPNDKEFGARMVNAGVAAFNLRHMAIAYHLYHDEGGRRNNYDQVVNAYQEAMETGKVECQKGLEDLDAQQNLP